MAQSLWITPLQQFQHSLALCRDNLGETKSLGRLWHWRFCGNVLKVTKKGQEKSSSPRGDQRDPPNSHSGDLRPARTDISKGKVHSTAHFLPPGCAAGAKPSRLRCPGDLLAGWLLPNPRAHLSDQCPGQGWDRQWGNSALVLWNHTPKSQ